MKCRVSQLRLFALVVTLVDTIYDFENQKPESEAISHAPTLAFCSSLASTFRPHVILVQQSILTFCIKISQAILYKWKVAFLISVASFK